VAVSRNWVYQAVADDVLPHGRPGVDGPIRFVAAEIDQWLDAQRRRLDAGPRQRRQARRTLTVAGWIIERPLRDGSVVHDIGYRVNGRLVKRKGGATRRAAESSLILALAEIETGAIRGSGASPTPQ